MNNFLGSSSPIDDAFALNFASIGFFTVVNNLWTWVAVITAAVSFWRIRTTSFPEKSDHQQPRIDRNPSGSRAQPSANTCVETQAPSPSPVPIPAAPSVCSVKGVDGVTEGAKFTLYYYKGEEMESDGADGDGEATVVKEWRDDDDDGVSWWDWERVTMRARIGEDMGMGWHRYQDLTVVNGNVVRLWDECRRGSQIKELLPHGRRLIKLKKLKIKN